MEELDIDQFKVRLRSHLIDLNPKARAIDIEIYLNAFIAYRTASKNINDNGVLCKHPRTGQPIENPYLKIQNQMGAVLSKMRLIKCNLV